MIALTACSSGPSDDVSSGLIACGSDDSCLISAAEVCRKATYGKTVTENIFGTKADIHRILTIEGPSEDGCKMILQQLIIATNDEAVMRCSWESNEAFANSMRTFVDGNTDIAMSRGTCEVVDHGATCSSAPWSTTSFKVVCVKDNIYFHMIFGAADTFEENKEQGILLVAAVTKALD